jgi:hypothetical protein
MVLTMEGSMKTMSWSRYHALSWSFARIRGHLRGGGAKRTRDAGKSAAVSPAAVFEAPAERTRRGRRFRSRSAARLLARMFRSVITFFRTWVLPVHTDF